MNIKLNSATETIEMPKGTGFVESIASKGEAINAKIKTPLIARSGIETLELPSNGLRNWRARSSLSSRILSMTFAPPDSFSLKTIWPFKASMFSRTMRLIPIRSSLFGAKPSPLSDTTI